jgi:hypothetical protein
MMRQSGRRKNINRYLDRKICLSEAAVLAITLLHKSGFLNNRRVFYRDSFARMIELQHEYGMFLKLIHAE